MDRQRAMELEKALQGHRDSPELKMVRQLLEYNLERVKTTLLTAMPETICRLQGEGEAYRTLARVFSRPDIQSQQ